MCQEALDLERSNGEERTESKCRKYEDHDLRYGTGPPAAGGCELSTTIRVKTAWKKFKDLLPVLSSCHLSFKTLGHV